jgi:hypothetical protein
LLPVAIPVLLPVFLAISIGQHNDVAILGVPANRHALPRKKG